ncbi:hypothetical protein GQ457_08G034650 [Hibiscus cannabinus]
MNHSTLSLVIGFIFDFSTLSTPLYLSPFRFFSTVAVVYTISCIYTTRELSFKKIMNAILKVWKRPVLSCLLGEFQWDEYNCGSYSVSHFKEEYGFPTIMKSKNLIKGKEWLVIFIFSILHLEMGFNHIEFEWLVIKKDVR